MKVLVGFSTAAGSTEGVARRMAQRLRAQMIDTDVQEIAGLTDISGYDAAVLGSAIHNGLWLPEASRVLKQRSGDLRSRPVWLFSVSSVGASSSFFPRLIGAALRRMQGETKEVSGFRKLLVVRDHRAFAGAIKKGDWSRTGDVFLRALGGRFGDHRDWADIDEWADSIAEDLRPTGQPHKLAARGLG